MAKPIAPLVTLQMVMPSEEDQNIIKKEMQEEPNLHLVAERQGSDAERKGFPVHATLAGALMNSAKTFWRENRDADTKNHDADTIPALHLKVDADKLEQVVHMMYDIEPIDVLPENVHEWVKTFDYLGCDRYATLLMDWFEAYQNEQEQLCIQANAILIDSVHAQSARVQKLLSVANQTKQNGFIELQSGAECRWIGEAGEFEPEKVRFVMLDGENIQVYQNCYGFDPETLAIDFPELGAPKKEFLEKHKIRS